MRKGLLLTGFTLLLLIAAKAQEKHFSYEQAFRGAPTGFSRNLPVIVRWLDDNHYLEMRETGPGTRAVFSVDVKSGRALPFSGTTEQETRQTPVAEIKDARNITPSPDGKWVAYTRADNNLYTRNISSGAEKQLTRDGSESILNGYSSWLYYEEILGRPTHYRAFWWSPDSRHIAFMRFDQSMVPVFPMYWAAGRHGYLENQRYPKAGDKNPEVKIGIASPENDATVWADFNEKDDQYFGMPYWTPGGGLWVQWMNRRQDNLKIYAIDLASGRKSGICEEKQATWIDLDDDDRISFLPSGKGFILKSDASGWRHMYRYDMSGKLLNPITHGDFTTGEIFRIDERAGLIYFKARKENSARWDLYSASLDGKKFSRLSAGDYSYTGMSISPKGNYFITSYSNANTPSTEVLMDTRGKIIRELGNARGESFSAYKLPRKELHRVKSADGLFDLPVLVTYPVNFDPARKYPVLVSIYGGPNAGTVYDTWDLQPAEIWWAQEGLVQVAVDNRSSGHFGKKGMNYIYRQLGRYEIEDFMACGRWLKQQPWVDGKKLCITGGSFGGYMTCMALTYGADVFDYGVANSSVTDWQLYDTHYTERYMNTPQENPDGYKQTAVTTYAGKYRGLLRIIHGTSDDNVHMQNSLQLIDTLENLKKHFELMIYPGERHSIGGAKGRHKRTEAYNFYYKYLLDREMPEEFWK